MEAKNLKDLQKLREWVTYIASYFAKRNVGAGIEAERILAK